jgi:short-subunit dehydrogenase
MKELSGKKALVTGAASGIGRALALALADEGMDLSLWDIDGDGLEEVAREARRRGVEVFASHVDLAEPGEITWGVQVLLARWDHLDLLVNNAGVVYYGPTELMTAGEWDWLLRVNLLAPIQLTRELLPVLLDRPEAHILNVCSIAGLVAGRRLAAYHTSKFGLVGFTEALRAEFAHRGLGVTALCPGAVCTRLLDSAIIRDRRRPLRFPGWLTTTPEHVAAAAVRAVRKNQGLALVTPAARLLWLFKRLFPGLLDFLNRFRRKPHRPCRKDEGRRMKDEARQPRASSFALPASSLVPHPSSLPEKPARLLVARGGEAVGAGRHPR